MYDVAIETLPEMPLACVKHVGPYPEMGKAFEALFNTIGAQNLWAQIEATVGVFFHNPEETPEEELVSLAAVALKPGASCPDGLAPYTLEAGRHAVMIHKGSYAKLSEAYAYFMSEWLPQSGEHHAARPSFEIYLNDPTETPEDELLTKICAPLA